MSKYKPTDEQQAVMDHMAAGNNVVVEAGAGTGKTETMNQGARVITGRVLYAAYNAAAKADAAARFPAHVKCSTLHGLAMSAVGRPFAHRLRGGRQNAKATAEKLRVTSQVDVAGVSITPIMLTKLALSTIRGFCRSADPEITDRHLPVLPGLPGLGDLRKLRQELDELRAAGDHDAAREAKALHSTLLAARRDLVAAILPIARRAWDDLCDPGGTRVPFEHDHYLKAYQLGDPLLPYDAVILDEAQDSNPCRSSIIQGQDQAQRIAIGDGCQQLYGWQGAVDALKTWPADVRLFLTQSWRYGPVVAAEANKWLSFIDTPLRVRGNPALPTVIGPIATPDAVLCRSNAGAVEQVIATLQAGRKPCLVGGAQEMVALAEAAAALKAGRRTTHPELFAFTTWGEVQEYSEEESGADLRVFVKLVDQHGPEALIAALANTVDERDADVVISTAHKSKGREWDRVRVHSDFPEPQPDNDNPISTEDAMLAYVTVTRAKLALDHRGLSWVDTVLAGRSAA